MSAYGKPIESASLQLTAMAQMVLQDLTEEGGVGWWDEMNRARQIFIADYIIGLTQSTESNLRQVVMHRTNLLNLWAAADHDMLGQIRRGRETGVLLGPPTPRASERGDEIAGHLSGYFRASGSILDTLAGLIVGTAGLKTDIVRSDWAVIRTSADAKQRRKVLGPVGPGRERQREVLDSVRALAEDAGPKDWLLWVEDFRNTQVHRASRTAFNFHAPPRHGAGFVHPLPRHPAQTEAEALVDSSEGEISDVVLTEDASATLGVVQAALITLTVEVTKTCITLWNQRRNDPTLITQPDSQWPTLRQGRSLAFGGANPTAKLPITTGKMLVGPETSARLKRGHFMQGGSRRWKKWLADDETH